MDKGTQTELLRLLHGELRDEQAQALRRRIEDDDELRSHYRQMESAWNALELPPSEPAPPGFAARVTATALGSDPGVVPVWFRSTMLGRMATAAALAGGIALGVILASPTLASQTGGSAETIDVFSSEPTLADSYFELMTDFDDSNLDEVAQ